MLEKAQARQEWLGLGGYNEQHATDLARACTCLVDGQGLLWGLEAPAIASPENAINLVMYWDGPSMGLLTAHEAQSALPSGVFVPHKHKRREALMRALQGRGYTPHETLMVKHG